MADERRKAPSLILLSAVFSIVFLAMPTALLAEGDLTGCWVGTVYNETTYLSFSDNSTCTFNGKKNCEVEYPLNGDPDHNIRLIYIKSDTQKLELLGNVNLDKEIIDGDDFFFSMGDNCPLPSTAVDIRDSKGKSGTQSAE
jgi:hypothetical protein